MVLVYIIEILYIFGDLIWIYCLQASEDTLFPRDENGELIFADDEIDYVQTWQVRWYSQALGRFLSLKFKEENKNDVFSKIMQESSVEERVSSACRRSDKEVSGQCCRSDIKPICGFLSINLRGLGSISSLCGFLSINVRGLGSISSL